MTRKTTMLFAGLSSILCGLWVYYHLHYIGVPGNIFHLVHHFFLGLRVSSAAAVVLGIIIIWQDVIARRVSD